MRAFRSWLNIVAVAAGAIGVFIAVAIAREMKPNASRRRQVGLHVDHEIEGVKPNPVSILPIEREEPIVVEQVPVAAVSLPFASSVGAAPSVTESENRNWGRLAVVAGAAVFALVAALGIVTSKGEAREPALQASVVQSDTGSLLLIKGQNFPPGETIELGLADEAGAQTSVRSSQSGDFMVQIAAPVESSQRTLKVLAAVAGKRVSATAEPDAAVLAVSSAFEVQASKDHAPHRSPVVWSTPTKAATVVSQGTVTRTKTSLATKTVAPTNTKGPATATRTKVSATATKTNAVTSTATKASASATSTVRPSTSTATKTAAPAATKTPVTVGTVVTFGNTDTNGVDDDQNWRYINGTNVLVPVKGSLKSLSVYVGADPQGKVRLALYKGDANEPRQLVAQTGEMVAHEGWNTVATTGAPIVDQGTYWVAAQTDNVNTVYRLAPDTSPSGSSIGWLSYNYGAFPAAIEDWHAVDDWSFSMTGTVATAAGNTSFTATPTDLPTMEVPETATVAPLPGTPTVTPTRTNTPGPATATRTSTAVSATATRTNTPAPATATRTSTPVATPGSGAGCVTNCGTPRFFCDTGSWAFCDDYRDLYCPSLNFLNDCKFPDMDGVGRHVSVVTYSATDPDYYPQRDNVFTPHGWFFNQQEHIHSEIEDGSFGIAMARHHQPIDITAERRIHFEADLKTSGRRYVRLMLSPQVTKSMVDDRDPPEEYRPSKALDIWFINGTFAGSVYPSAPDGGAFFVQTPRYYGTDNVRDLIDVYVTRTHVKVVVNGTTYVNENIPNVGFDQAYVYLEQASYNPCKDNECAEKLQIFHWDNFAFDGPVLADNSLVPAGQQDVVFMAYGQASCSVKGVTATPASPYGGFTWMSWVARMPVQAVSTTDVSCTNGEGGQFWADTGRTPFDFEIVKR